MVQSNRITILVDDNAVYLDEWTYINLDLHTCGIPEDIHALHWLNGEGQLEFRDTRHNQIITELPEWAHKALVLWETAYKLYPPTITASEINIVK